MSLHFAKVLGVVFLCLLAQPARTRACASCGCGDPTLTALFMEKPFRNRIRLALEERLGAHSAGIFFEKSLVSRTTFSASWSPTAFLTLAAQVPMVLVRSDADKRETRHIIGLGDVDWWVRLLAYRDRRFSPRHILALLAGLKTPTGPRINDSTGYPAEDDLQPGSGSWDPEFGAGYSYFGSLLSIFVTANYRYTTSGYRGYRRGSVLGASLAVQFAINSRTALVLGTDIGYTLASQLATGALAPDTGGFLLSAAPGLLIALRTNFLLRLGLQVPVLEHWRGLQHETSTGIVTFILDV